MAATRAATEVAAHADLAAEPRSALDALLAASIPLLAAPLLAAAPSLAHANEGSAIGASYLHYKEANGRMKVGEPIIWLKTTVADVWDISASATVDTMSGASPRYVANDTGRPYQSLSSASIRDRREAGDVRVKRRFGDWAVAVSHAQSHEDDYDSKAWGAEVEWSLNDKATTLTAGFGRSGDVVGSSENPNLREPRAVRDFTIGVTQVLNANALFQSVLELSRGKGYYNDPYKLTITTNFDATGNVDSTRPFSFMPDTRPANRRNVAWLNKLRLALPDRNAVLQLDARLTRDSWGISTQALEASWVQSFGEGWQITPGLRYYSQSAADFYSPTIPTPRPQLQSSDQRLAAFGSLTPKLNVGYRFASGTQIDASYAKLIQKGNWKLGGGSTSTFERFSADLFTVSVVHRF